MFLATCSKANVNAIERNYKLRPWSMKHQQRLCSPNAATDMYSICNATLPRNSSADPAQTKNMTDGCHKKTLSDATGSAKLKRLATHQS
jgi:hypothetical protein